MFIIRAEPHLTESDGVDEKDWVSVHARTSYTPTPSAPLGSVSDHH